MKWFYRLARWLRSFIQTTEQKEETTMVALGKIWIDMSSLGSSALLCDCQITHDDESQRSHFKAVIPGVTVEEFNRIFSGETLNWNEETSGILADGRAFNACIATISRYSPSGTDEIEVEGELSSYLVNSSAPSDPSKWRFRLSNVKFHHADLWTKDEQGGGALDSIEFLIDERKWRLTDTWLVRWKDVSKSEKAKVVLNGVLELDFQANDTDEQISDTVDDICSVLSVALSRSVTWLSYSVMAEDGAEVRGLQRATWVTSFDKHGLQPVTNDSPGSLKDLVERGLPIIRSNRDWFRKTLGMLNQAQIADMVDVKCSVLYTLVDRISSYLVQKTGIAEIDADLKSRARKKDFIAKLHNVLSELSPENWTEDNTNAVLTTIKQWNKTPAFVPKIQRACASLSLPEPDKTLLRPRNDLLHDGELYPQDSDVVGHYLELDWVVLTLVLRMLGYEGTYYHPKFGQYPVELREQLASVTEEQE